MWYAATASYHPIFGFWFWSDCNFKYVTPLYCVYVWVHIGTIMTLSTVIVFVSYEHQCQCECQICLVWCVTEHEINFVQALTCYHHRTILPIHTLTHANTHWHWKQMLHVHGTRTCHLYMVLVHLISIRYSYNLRCWIGLSLNPIRWQSDLPCEKVMAFKFWLF